MRYFLATAVLSAILAAAPVGVAFGQESAEAEAAAIVAEKEYFVQQQAGEALVVRVDAYEAEFSSTLSTEEGEALGRSGLREARMLPVYQFVPEGASSRQVDVDVRATQVTNRTEFNLELIRLNVRDQRSADLASAYRRLSLGLESLPDGNVASWSVKIQTILQAADLFARIGMEEMRLWCRVFAAHLALHQLRDPQTAFDWAGEIMGLPRIERFPEIAFATSKIRGSAAAMSGAGSNLPAMLEETRQRARALGFRYEEALALLAIATDLAAAGTPAAALERLNTALEIAGEIAAADLAAAIREEIVGIHEEFGDAEASGSVLQDIETHLLETGESEELARNLLRQGRLFMERHRYAEAVDTLSRAPQLEQSALNRIEVELALGTALNESGRGDEALAHLYRAITQPDSGDFRKPSTAVDLSPAFRQVAALHRQQGDFERMERVRARERDYIQGSLRVAEWAYQRAVDALIRSGSAAGETQRRFESALGPAGGQRNTWQNLGLLQYCALPGPRGAREPRCEGAATAGAAQQVRAGGGARETAEADLLHARLLGLNGQAGQALSAASAQMERLLERGRDELGAWYWEWRQALIENYLGLAIAVERGDPSDGAARSFLALTRARALERDADGPGPDLDGSSLDIFLSSLPRDTAVLSYFLSDRMAHAWVAGRSGTRRFDLQAAAETLAACADLRDAIQAGDWDGFDALAQRLGQRLLQPVSESLPGTILFLGHGPLLGIPLDALTLHGAPLAGRHEVFNLDAWPPAGAALDPALAAPAAVFLAGDPQDWSAEFATRLEPSREVRAVTDRFVGPGLHSVLGTALLADEFDDPSYAGASLVHLSVPGVIDLAARRRSAFFLSEPGRGAGRERLEAEAVRAMPLEAGLLFLSRTEFRGRGALLDNELGVISSGLAAGAGAVIATLWPVEDEVRSRLVAAFYEHLAERENIGAALQLAKLDSMRSGPGREWSSFQLFLD